MSDHLTDAFFDCIPKKRAIHHDISDGMKTQFIFGKLKNEIRFCYETESEVLESLDEAFKQYEGQTDPVIPVIVVLPAFLQAKKYACEMLSGREKAIKAIEKIKRHYHADEEVFSALELAQKLLERK